MLHAEYERILGGSSITTHGKKYSLTEMDECVRSENTTYNP
jgi:hypothetical protein